MSWWYEGGPGWQSGGSWKQLVDGSVAGNELRPSIGRHTLCSPEGSLVVAIHSRNRPFDLLPGGSWEIEELEEAVQKLRSGPSAAATTRVVTPIIETGRDGAWIEGKDSAWPGGDESRRENPTGCNRLPHVHDRVQVAWQLDGVRHGGRNTRRQVTARLAGRLSISVDRVSERCRCCRRRRRRRVLDSPHASSSSLAATLCPLVAPFNPPAYKLCLLAALATVGHGASST